MNEATTVKTLPCQLTEMEWRERSNQLAEAELERKRAEEALDEATSDWKETKTGLQEEIDSARVACRRLAKTVKTRSEEREVECAIHVSGSTATIIRIDTGEIVATRAATVQEMQASLPL